MTAALNHPFCSSKSSSSANTWRPRDNKFISGVIAALIVGIGFRLWLYLLNDSFWRDESMFLLNIAQKSFWELLSPLQYGQGGPIPLLWFYHFLYLLGLGAELPIRALSLIASIMALFLFYRLATLALINDRAILFSTWLLAVSPGAILFAAQAKPYSLDLLIACGFLYLAMPWFIDIYPRRKNSLLFWYAGLACWFSFPAVFVSGGIAAGLLLNRQRNGFRPALLLIFVILFSFSLEFFIFIRHLNLSKNFIEFSDLMSLKGWKASSYAPFFAYLGERKEFFQQSFIYLWAMGICLVIIGIWESGREYGVGWVAVLILPLLISLFASGIKHYPISGRLYLFGTPGIYLLLGYAVGYLFREIRWPKLLSVSLIVMLFLCFKSSLLNLGRHMSGVRDGLQFIIDNQRMDDIIVCDTFAFPSVAYYRLLALNKGTTLNCDIENLEKFAWGLRLPASIKFEEIIPLIPESRRIWCIAETGGYARTNGNILSYWRELTSHLNKERNLMASYISGKVQVNGFSRRNRE